MTSLNAEEFHTYIIYYQEKKTSFYLVFSKLNCEIRQRVIVKQDIQDFSLNLTFDEISRMKYDQFKTKVKSACKIYTLKRLLAIKARHSKGDNLEYARLETNKYLLSKVITAPQALLLFKIRSRMLNVKMNFKETYQNDIILLQCDLCSSGKLDDQTHVPMCPALQSNQNIQFDYSKLFSTNVTILKKAITEYEAAWNEMVVLRSQKEANMKQN